MLCWACHVHILILPLVEAKELVQCLGFDCFRALRVERSWGFAADRLSRSTEDAKGLISRLLGFWGLCI